MFYSCFCFLPFLEDRLTSCPSSHPGLGVENRHHHVSPPFDIVIYGLFLDGKVFAFQQI